MMDTTKKKEKRAPHLFDWTDLYGCADMLNRKTETSNNTTKCTNAIGSFQNRKCCAVSV